ncbi:MAG: hypothetical protein KQJ78_24000 [Deltaproteobacteria bacterium]|nr:hypothetical protein [Deltaproteobacteria bacterium]
MQEVLREAMLTQGLLPVSCTPKGLQCADMLFFLRKLNASEGLQRDAVLAFFTGQSSADLKTPSGMRSLIIGDED